MTRLMRGMPVAIAAALAIAACQPDRPEGADAPAAAPQTTDDVMPATLPPVPGTVQGAPGDTIRRTDPTVPQQGPT